MLSPIDISAIEDEIYQHDIAILASEDWSTLYDKDPATHMQLIKLEASMGRNLRRYFRELADNAESFINWSRYANALYEKSQIMADDNFNVAVMLVDDALDESDETFLKIMFDEIATGAAIGATYGENVYRRYTGVTTTTAEIQRFAREQAAQLVGKTIDKNGLIIDNPNADYRISNTTRKDIQSSIRTSLSLGETQQLATDRLRNVIKNPKRAELIAQTEAVNSFQGGLVEFGKLSGAVGKESQALNTDDACATYDKEGVVPLNHLYGGSYLAPAYHPRCRCGLRLIYREEVEQ